MYKYNTAVLQAEDKDYQFILRSISDKNSENNPKVLHVLKINPVNEKKVSQMQNKPIYLYGVKSHEVNDIIMSSFTLNSKFHRCVSKKFETELSYGRSLCNVDNELKKKSFVFVTSPKHPANWKPIVRQIIDRDSNENYIIGGTFRNNTDDLYRKI